MSSTTLETEVIPGFLTIITDLVSDNILAILAFAGAILVWGVAKKWIFGGTNRI